MSTWDQSHDWVLYRYVGDRTRVTIRFRESPASVAELIALRRCLPRYRNTPPADLRASLGASRELSFGELPGPDARQLVERAKAHGLDVVAESACFISYLPFDRTTGCALLIENDAEAAAVALAMLKAGVPVEQIAE